MRHFRMPALQSSIAVEIRHSVRPGDFRRLKASRGCETVREGTAFKLLIRDGRMPAAGLQKERLDGRRGSSCPPYSGGPLAADPAQIRPSQVDDRILYGTAADHRCRLPGHLPRVLLD